MRHAAQQILADFEFWLIIVAAMGFVADAVAETTLTPVRLITIVAMVALAISHVYRKLRLQKEKNVPFLIVVGKPDEQYRDTLTQVEAAHTRYGLNVQTLGRSFGLLHEDWIFHRESPLPPDPDVWRETILKIDRKFWRLAERVPGRKVYHLFMNGPATLALALGATIGGRSEFVFYHYMAGTGVIPYHPVADFSAESVPQGPHMLKTRVDQFTCVRVDGLGDLDPSELTEVYVAIHLAGHNPIGDVKKRGKTDRRPVVTIESLFPGTIPLEADWIRLSREVSSVLLDLAGREQIQRLHLFLSTPLPVAFCVGSAIGRFVRATVHNYYRTPGAYAEAFKLEEL